MPKSYTTIFYETVKKKLLVKRYSKRKGNFYISGNYWYVDCIYILRFIGKIKMTQNKIFEIKFSNKVSNHFFFTSFLVKKR